MMASVVSVSRNWQVFQEKPDDFTKDWKVYRNEEYGFEVKYPKNWRLAQSIIEWRIKDATNPNYTPKIDDWTMITNLSQEEEKNYLQVLENYDGIGSALDHIKIADGRSIIIQPTTALLEDLRTMETPGYEISNFRELKTNSGLILTYFREKITWDMDRDTEVIFVPYFVDKTLWDDKKITFIRLSIEKNEYNLEKDLFDKIIFSFKFF